MNPHPLRGWTIALSLIAFCAMNPPKALAQGAPRLVINDVTVPFETASGAGNAAFTVSFADTTPHGSVTVFFSTTGGTATAGNQCSTAGVDYASVNSSALSFNSSENSKQINITVCGDTRDEPDETFFINLFNASGGAVIQDAQGQATLIDDDNPPSLRINDVTVTEGNSGAANSVFTVTVSGSTDNPINVSYATANRTATAGSCGTASVDYATTSGSLAFAANQTSQTLTIPVCGDAVREGNEQFDVRLSGATNANIQDGTGVGTITDNEPLPTLTITGPAGPVAEPGGKVLSVLSASAVFTVALGGSSTAQTVTVQFATAPGGASGGSACTAVNRQGQSITLDYIIRNGTLTFSPGTATREIGVSICQDSLNEQNETFHVNLSNPVNATVASGTATATIRDR